jgi:tRNA pseudouridine55 synthase
VTHSDGLLVVDKPTGVTSHGVVQQFRRLLDSRKIGHAGTLDPAATGVLVLGLGRGTRLLTYLVGADKEYTATIRLGWATVTDDAEGERVGPLTPVTVADLGGLAESMRSFLGPIEQRPSSVSAIKVDGQRAYDRVRAGDEVVLAARRVTVHRFDLLGEPRPGDGWVDLDVLVGCSSGTYVRALARDLGARLGLGGHVVELRRTALGPFAASEALDASGATATAAAAAVQELGAVARRFLPVVVVEAADVPRVRSGLRIPAPGDAAGDAASHAANDAANEVPTALVDGTGALLAVASRGSGGLWRYGVVFT